jgi:hypothetical protein
VKTQEMETRRMESVAPLLALLALVTLFAPCWLTLELRVRGSPEASGTTRTRAAAATPGCRVSQLRNNQRCETVKAERDAGACFDEG